MNFKLFFILISVFVCYEAALLTEQEFIEALVERLEEVKFKLPKLHVFKGDNRKLIVKNGEVCGLQNVQFTVNEFFFRPHKRLFVDADFVISNLTLTGEMTYFDENARTRTQLDEILVDDITGSFKLEVTQHKAKRGRDPTFEIKANCKVEKVPREDAVRAYIAHDIHKNFPKFLKKFVESNLD